jgi:hypothetical protein
MKNLILGHTWQQIQRAQRGGHLSKRIDTSKPPTIQLPTEKDLQLLEQHGFDGLEKLGFHGTLDRVRHLKN